MGELFGEFLELLLLNYYFPFLFKHDTLLLPQKYVTLFFLLSFKFPPVFILFSASSSLALFILLLRILYFSHCSGIYRDAYIDFFILKASSWRLFSFSSVKASINVGQRHIILSLFVSVNNDHLPEFADRLGLILRFDIVVETDLPFAIIRFVFVVFVGDFILALAKGVQFGIDILLGVVGKDAGDVGFAALRVVGLFIDYDCQRVGFLQEICVFAHAVII